jgi:alkyldihydroxyacetonephosphate synthase
MTHPPTAPIGLDAASARAWWSTPAVTVDETTFDALRATGATVDVTHATRAEASRDWWPLVMTRAALGEVGQLASAVVRPTHAAQVSSVLAVCDRARVPVTAAGGRSGVMGGAIPLFGGIVLDLTDLRGIRSVDVESGIVDVACGTFGDELEDELRTTHGLTIGHWPQSVALATVGGWLACRGAGQLSNRYGTIGEIVVGLDAVLADGTELTTGGWSHRSTGPDLQQLLVGSEGTLAVLTGARLLARPAPSATWRGAWAFPSFADGAEVCRRIARRGPSPAALRLYDAAEADRHWQTGDVAVLLAFDEGDEATVALGRRLTEEECGAARRLDDDLVDRWWGHRNDVSALEALVSRGYMVDTLELTARWRDVPALYVAVRDAIAAVPGVISSTSHLSHSYPDAACLYFTFAGRPAGTDDPDAVARLSIDAWNAGTDVALAGGASLSHHHGIGLARARFLRRALGDGAFDALGRIKQALDPNGILNPGKLGLPSAFGTIPPLLDGNRR